MNVLEAWQTREVFQIKGLEKFLCSSVNHRAPGDFLAPDYLYESLFHERSEHSARVYASYRFQLHPCNRLLVGYYGQGLHRRLAYLLQAYLEEPSQVRGELRVCPEYVPSGYLFDIEASGPLFVFSDHFRERLFYGGLVFPFEHTGHPFDGKRGLGSEDKGLYHRFKA